MVVGNHWQRIVKLRDLRFVGLSMNQSAGQSRRNMMLKMMLLSARLRLKRSAKMKPLVTQPTPSAPSGPRKCALLRRNLSRSSHQSQGVPRNQGRSVLHLDVDSRKEKKSAMTRPRQLSRMLLRNSVLLSLREHASMSQNLCPSLSLLRSVLMFPRKSVPGPRQTQGRSRSQLLRSGAMCQLRNQDLHKQKIFYKKKNITPASNFARVET